MWNDNRPLIDRYGEAEYMEKVIIPRRQEDVFAFYNNSKYASSARCIDTKDDSISGLVKSTASLDGILNPNSMSDMI